MDLIFAGKHCVGAASAGVAIKTHSAAQIALTIVDFLMILVDCEKAGRGASAPTAQPAPCAPGERARTFITETTMQNQDLKIRKLLMQLELMLMLKNLQTNLDRIIVQFEQIARILEDTRSECVRLRAENKRLRGLLEQEHGFHKSHVHQIVACLMGRKFRAIEGGKACTNTEQKYDA